MGKGLPHNWVEVGVSDVFEVNPGHQNLDISLNEKVSFIPMPAVSEESNIIELVDNRIYSEVKSGYSKFIENDVLFAKITPCMENGKVAIAKGLTSGVGCGSTEFHVFRGNNFSSNKYLFYYLIQKSFRGYCKSRFTGAVGHRRVPKQIFDEKTFPMPPLPEQQRIVAKLDTLFEHIENTKTRLEKVPTLLKNFRQAVLTQAVTGKLTEEWREGKEFIPVDLSIVEREREIRGIRMRSNTSVKPEPLYPSPEGWLWCRLREVALKITDGAHNTPKVLKEGFPYLMAKDLTGGFMDFSQEQFLGEKDHRELWNKCLPEVGDLLIVNIGAGTGNNVLVSVKFEFSFKNIAIVKRSSVLVPMFLKFYFDNQKSVIFNSQTRGGAQPFLSLTALNDIDIVVPPLEEQIEIVRRVESLFAKADAIEAKYQLLKEKIDNLPQTILSKAFKGELVEQLPTDGSAADLLKEIQQLKTQIKKKK